MNFEVVINLNMINVNISLKQFNFKISLIVV